MNTDHFFKLTGAEIQAAVVARAVTATQIAEQALRRAEAAGRAGFGVFTRLTPERALAEAARVDRVVASGGDPGPLAGVPYAVKNLFDLQGEVTLAGSKINRDLPPAGRDATAVERLARAGAVCLGAVNMGEYAYDFVTDNAHDGPTRNPWDRTRSAGGSSGGSAAAVAAGIVPFALATDTNGSIRVPASFCGLWGLKPTFGRLSRAGSFPFVDSLDHIGPLARSVADLAAVYDVLQGPDPRDPVCRSGAAEPVGPSLEAAPGDVRVGLLGSYFESRLTDPARQAVAHVASALGASTRWTLPQVDAARGAAYVITASEGGQFHLGRLRTRAADFDPASRDRFRAGALLPAAWYHHAQRFRAWWREQLRDIFTRVDVLVAPATPVPATLLGQETMEIEGATLAVRPNLGLFTQPLSFVGLPVVAAPVWLTGSTLPIAVQLVAAPWNEAKLLQVARRLEQAGACRAPVAPWEGAPA